MSQTLATPPPATALRRFVARVWEDPDSRSTVIGVVGALLIHLLLWLVVPQLLRIEGATAATFDASARQFDIELAPDAFAEPEPPPPSKFVETNPDAPVNEPDRTTNFGAQSQQVAQETPTPDGRSDRPATEGKTDSDSTQIVSGRLLNPLEQLEAVPAIETPPPTEATADAARAEQNPLTGFEKTEGQNEESYGSNVARIPENVRPVPERIEGAPDVPFVDGASAVQPAIDPLRPRPRPQITKQPQVRPAVLADNKFGTSNIGNIAYDAKWNNYGAYLQRLIDTVQIQWERILIERRTYPPSGSTVAVKFILDSEGRIAKIVDVNNQSTDSAAAACVSGITERAPYGPWTSDMRAMLGEQQEMTFTFYYQ